jgi:hypothetical protein
MAQPGVHRRWLTLVDTPAREKNDRLRGLAGLSSGLWQGSTMRWLSQAKDDAL